MRSELLRKEARRELDEVRAERTELLLARKEIMGACKVKWSELKKSPHIPFVEDLIELCELLEQQKTVELAVNQSEKEISILEMMLR